MTTRQARTLLLAGAAVATALTISACAGAPATAPADRAGTVPGASGAPTSAALTARAESAISHIHAVTRDPKTQSLLLATHEGLFRQDQGGLQAVGPAIDLMSFTVSSDGTYYASGHPGPQTDLPQPLGLITSRDSGQSWQVASRGGGSDFHAMAVTPTAVVGFDGALRVSRDRTSWTEGTITSPPRTLAVAPGSGTLLATTAAGLMRSDDDGSTWRLAPSPPELLVLVSWADEKTVVGATSRGRIATSGDSGQTWTTGPEPLGPIDALWAARTPDGQVEVMAAIGTTVIRTLDSGATTETLVGS